MGVQWQHFVSGQEQPGNTIRGGQEANGSPFFVARGSPDEGRSLNPGKFGPTTGRGALFAAGGDEKYVGKYELLVGDESSIKWIDASGPCNGDGLNLVECGREEDGTPLWFGIADHEGGVFPGKVGPKLTGCNIGYGGKELTVQNYKVLAHA